MDNLYPIEHWPEVFKGKDILVRVDAPEGLGHHKHVKTAGEGTKFGLPPVELVSIIALVPVFIVNVSQNLQSSVTNLV